MLNSTEMSKPIPFLYKKIRKPKKFRIKWALGHFLQKIHFFKKKKSCSKFFCLLPVLSGTVGRSEQGP